MEVCSHFFPLYPVMQNDILNILKRLGTPSYYLIIQALLAQNTSGNGSKILNEPKRLTCELSCEGELVSAENFFKGLEATKRTNNIEYVMEE